MARAKWFILGGIPFLVGGAIKLAADGLIGLGPISLGIMFIATGMRMRKQAGEAANAG